MDCNIHYMLSSPFLHPERASFSFMEWKIVEGERVLGMELRVLGVMEHCVFSVWGCCCLSCLTAVHGMGISLFLREQPGTPRIWIGSGESTSEKRGWGNSGVQPRERCPLARLLEPLPTVFAMSPSPWPPPPPPESNSPVSRVGELGEGATPVVGWKPKLLTDTLAFLCPDRKHVPQSNLKSGQGAEGQHEVTPRSSCQCLLI